MTADAANPFVGDFRININLYNQDLGTTDPFPSFFSDVVNDFALATSTTIMTLTGTNSVLLAWNVGDRVFTNSLDGTGNPDGISLFRSAVNNFPLTGLTNEDFIAFEETGRPALVTRAGTDLTPRVAITSPADGALLDSTSVVVSGTALDDVDVAKVELSTDETTWVLATGTTSWSGTVTLAEGPNTIFARATDTAGNTATVSIAVTVDTPPTLAIASPADGAALASTFVVVSGTASDNGAVEMVELSLDGTNYVLATGTTSWLGTVTLAEGPNTIFARATDTAGNTATVSIAVTVDTVSPVVSISLPVDDASLAITSVTVSGTASDDVGVAKVELSTDGTTWMLATGTSSWSGTLTLAEGPNTIFARATDTAGNTATVSLAVTVDSVKPAADAGEDQRADAGDTVSFDASGSSDDVAIVSHAWDFGDGTTGTGETTTHVYSEPGTYTVTLTVRDAAGNADTDLLTVTVETPPEGPGPSPPLTTFAGIGVVAAAAAVAALLLWKRRVRGK